MNLWYLYRLDLCSADGESLRWAYEFVNVRDAALRFTYTTGTPLPPEVGPGDLWPPITADELNLIRLKGIEDGKALREWSRRQLTGD